MSNTNEISGPVTGWKAAQLMTARYAELGIEKVVNGPMIYIYGNKGAFVMTKGLKTQKNGKVREVSNVDLESFMIWMETHIQNSIAGVKTRIVKNVPNPFAGLEFGE